MATVPRPRRVRSAPKPLQSEDTPETLLRSAALPSCVMISRLYPVTSEVGEQSVVRLPAVGEFGLDTEVDGLVGGVGVEQVGYSGAGDDDAGVAVAGCQDAQAASF